MFLSSVAGRRYIALRVPEQSVMSADWREIELAVRRGNAHCSCSSQPIQLCDHISQLSYISVGQNCNHLHTAGYRTLKSQARCVIVQLWILYRTRYDETCGSWFVCEIIPSWLSSISELGWVRELNLPPEGDNDELFLKKARRTWCQLPNSNSLPPWSNEVFPEKLIVPHLFRNFPRIMERKF